MQIWLIRDAQTPVHQIELTPWRLFKWLCMGVLLLAVLNLLALWLLEAIGLDDSAERQSLTETQYERKLIQLEAQLVEMNARLKGMDATRQQMLQDQPLSPGQPSPGMAPILTPVPISPAPGSPNVQGGQGGPMMAQVVLPAERSFSARLHKLQLETLNVKAHSEAISGQMRVLQEYRLASPTGYPLPYQALVTSPPGYRVDPFTGRSSWHAGTDYGAYPGTPILATGDGYVVRAEWDDEFGNVVEISHPGVNMMTRYAHAQEIFVRPGQRVAKGDAIASVGSTGRSTGPHLHYEVR
jgi:murein DD-endopeptidase MepM/ murein hydrolase activator NlpD